MLRIVSIFAGLLRTFFKVISFTLTPFSSSITALIFPSTCFDSPTEYKPFFNLLLTSDGKLSKSGNNVTFPLITISAWLIDSPIMLKSEIGKSITTCNPSDLRMVRDIS